MANLKQATTPPADMSNWVQIDSATKVAPPPVADQSSQPGYEPLSIAPAPPILSTDVDRQRQFYRRGVSQYRIPPLPTKANPSINASTRSVATQVVVEAIAAIPPSSGGGSINGTTSAPFVPYTTSPDTLADTTWTFTPSGNIWANAQTTSEINMQSGGNQVELTLNVSGESGLLIVDSVGDLVQMDVKPGSHEALFSVFDAAGDAFEINAQNGSGVSASLVGSTVTDSIISEVINAKVLQQMENSLGGLVLLELNSTGTADFELSDQVGSFAELFLSGASTGHFFLIEDSTSSNSLRIDVNKTTVGNVAVTLTSPKPSIALGSSTSPTIFAGSAAPTGSAPNASLYLRSGGTHAGLSLLYVYDAATTSWIGIA